MNRRTTQRHMKLFSIFLAILIVCSSLGMTFADSHFTHESKENGASEMDASISSYDVQSGEEEAVPNSAKTTDTSTITAGTYYINNMYSRYFLGHENQSGIRFLDLYQGKTADLGDETVWEIEVDANGYYYIKNTFTVTNADNTTTTYTYYLQDTYNTKDDISGYLAIGEKPRVTTRARWSVTEYDEGYRIVNLNTHRVLHSDSNGYPTLQDDPTYNDENQKYWRFVDEDTYQENEVLSLSGPSSGYTTSLYGSIRFMISRTTASATGTSVGMLADDDDFAISVSGDTVYSVSRMGLAYVLQAYECMYEDVEIIHRPTGSTVSFVWDVYPMSGSYVIRNGYQSKYLIASGSSLSTVTSYSPVDASTFTLEPYGSGYFYIKSSSGTYLTNSGDANLTFSAKVAGSSNQLWKFIARDNHRFSIQSKSNVTNNTLYTSTSTSASLVYRTAYTSHTSNDEWVLIKKDRPTFAVPGTTSMDARALSYGLNYELSITSYGDANTYRYIENDALLTAMQESRLLIFGGHGAKTSITTGGNAVVGLNYLYESDIDALPSGALSNNMLVIYLSCEGGLGGTGADNMVTATYAKGAQMVVGFSIKIDTVESQKWIQYVMEYLLDGYHINEAIDKADYQIQHVEMYDAPTTSDTYQVAIGNGTAYPFADS